MPALLFATLLFGTANADPGAALFRARCAGCHGDGGHTERATGNLPDLGSPGWQKSTTDAQIREIIANGIFPHGKQRMPAFRDRLSSEEQKALVAYVRQLGKTKRR